MAKKILWLDNDPSDVWTLLKVVRRHGYDVELATRLGQAWNLLAEESYDLLILDVMIPTVSEEEERLFPPIETDSGHQSGLCFYRRMQQDPVRGRPPVFVFTLRPDAAISESFRQAGLPQSCFAWKFDLRHPGDFLKKIEEVIESRHAPSPAPPQR